MRIASAKEIAANFASYLEASKRGPVVVTRQGRPVAVLLKAKDPDALERLLMGHSPQLQAILEAARKRFRAGEGIPSDVFWQQVEAENARKVSKRGTRRNGRSN